MSQIASETEMARAEGSEFGQTLNELPEDVRTVSLNMRSEIQSVNDQRAQLTLNAAVSAAPANWTLKLEAFDRVTREEIENMSPIARMPDGSEALIYDLDREKLYEAQPKGIRIVAERSETPSSS